MDYAALTLRSLAALLALSAFSLGLAADAEPSRQHRTAPASDRALDHADAGAATATVYAMAVEGMMCESSCAAKVKTALSTIEGVSAVDLDFTTKTARVHMRDRHTLTPADCDASFDNQGYFVTDFRRLD